MLSTGNIDREVNAAKLLYRQSVKGVHVGLIGNIEFRGDYPGLRVLLENKFASFF